MQENIQLVNNNDLKDNFQLVTTGNQQESQVLPFLVFGILLVLCSAAVYFMRSIKGKISPGDDFEIIE